MYGDSDDNEIYNSIVQQTNSNLSESGFYIMDYSINTSKKLNFADLFLNWLTPNLRKELYNSKLNKKYGDFLTGLSYEYGIDDCKIDLAKAYEIYKKNAEDYD